MQRRPDQERTTRSVFARLHIRLLALILICVAPAFGIIIYSGLEQRSRAAADAEQQALAVAHQLAARQRDLMAQSHQLLESLARSPEARGLTSPGTCNRLLASLSRVNRYYVDLFVADAKGRIRCSANPVATGVRVADRGYFRRARQTLDFAIGDFQTSRITGHETIIFAYPWLADGAAFGGIVAVGIDPAWLNGLLTDVDLPAGSIVTVLDSSGTILARTGDPGEWVGRTVPEVEQIRAVMARQERTAVESVWLDGVKRIAGVVPIFNASGDLFVRVGIPSQHAFAPVEHAFYRNLALLAGAAVFMLGLGWVASHRLVLRRVADLSETARRLGTGNLDARTRLAPDDGELGQLARTLDEMAAGMQSRQERIENIEQDLRRSNRALRVLNTVTRILGQARGEAALLEDICRAVVEIGGYRLAWVGYAQHDEGRRVHPMAWAGYDSGYLANLNMTWDDSERGQGPSGTAIRTGRTCVVRQISTDTRYAAWRQEALSRGYASSISIPLLDGEPFGALTVLAAEPAAFDSEEAALLEEAARDLAFGILALRAHAERNQLEESLQLRNRAIEASHNGQLIVRLGEGLQIVSVNSAFLQLVCPEHRDLIGKELSRLGQCCGFGADGIELLTRQIRSGQGGDLSLALGSSTGDRRWLDVSLDLVAGDADRQEYALLEFRDVTANRLYEKQIEHQANHDLLTGLPNRNLLMDRLGQALLPVTRGGGNLFILWLDLDRFRAINDSLGHQAGDTALRILAERLAGADGCGTVARAEADSFVLIADGIASQQAAASLAERLRETVQQPMQVGGQEVVLSASIGIAAAPCDGEDADTLLRNASVAMDRARESGRDGFCFYAEEMNASAFPRLRLEIALRQAMEAEELFLVYQPKVGLQDGQITGAEALVRWRHPEMGLVSPGDFIPLAEESGLILPIGRWVLERACAQIRAWLDEGLDCRSVAVNVSPVQFFREDIVSQVTELLAAYRLEPRFLMIEITEGTLMRDPERAIEMMQALKRIGIKLAIDDFGTGYSSLSALKRFPIDYLKIDRSFVAGLASNESDGAIAMAVISLARSLELQVVAEGVETPEQREYLRTRQCDEMQGYLFSPPLPAPRFAGLLQQERERITGLLKPENSTGDCTA